MSGSNDRDAIQQFLEEQFGMIEGDGAVSIVGLVHYAHTGEVQIHAAKTGQAHWGKPDEMARTFDALATRHARGVVGGGAQQYQITVCRGTDGRPTSVLPFVRVGARNIAGPEGSLATEPPTPMGLTQQAQRWGEQITQMAFHGMGQLQHSQQRALDARDSKIENMEKINADLWLACKNLLLELDKRRHDERMSEIAAARMAEFQKQVMTLAPALVNMMTGKEIVPLSAADTSILDTIAAFATPDDVRLITAGLATKEGGATIASTLQDRFNQYHRRKAEQDAVEKRLMAGLPARSYEEAERDAAGEAIRALRGAPVETKALPTGKTANGVNGANGANGHVETATSDTPVDGEKLWDDLFTSAEPGKIEMLIGVLGSAQPGLADRLRARFEASKK